MTIAGKDDLSFDMALRSRAVLSFTREIIKANRCDRYFADGVHARDRGLKAGQKIKRLQSEAFCRELLPTREDTPVARRRGGRFMGGRAWLSEAKPSAGDLPASAAFVAAARARCSGGLNAEVRAFWAWAVGALGYGAI